MCHQLRNTFIKQWRPIWDNREYPRNRKTGIHLTRFGFKVLRRLGVQGLKGLKAWCRTIFLETARRLVFSVKCNFSCVGDVRWSALRRVLLTEWYNISKSRLHPCDFCLPSRAKLSEPVTLAPPSAGPDNRKTSNSLWLHLRHHSYHYYYELCQFARVT